MSIYFHFRNLGLQVSPTKTGQAPSINLLTLERYFLLNVVLDNKTTILEVFCFANEHAILIEQLCFGLRKGYFVKWPSGSEGHVNSL